MTRRETLLKLSGITGFPVVLGACSMDAIRRAEANLGDRMKHPGTGVQFSGLPEVVSVLILAKYPPTPQQTQVTQQRARTAARTIVQRERRRIAAAVKDGTKPATILASLPGPDAAPSEEMKAAAAILRQQTGSPVIALDTKPDNRLQGTRAVMMWNLQTQHVVGNDVYDIPSPPAKGQVARWERATAYYAGDGN